MAEKGQLRHGYLDQKAEGSLFGRGSGMPGQASKTLKLRGNGVRWPKNNQFCQQELVELTVKSGIQDEEDWVPFL